MSALDEILALPIVTHDLVQGSNEWLAFRMEHDGASEAAAMLGLSKNVTRGELLAVKHSGIAREFSDFVQKRILDKGHEVEALARPLVEAEIGEDLYPATYSRGRMSASCDGITLDDRLVLEHKQWNEELAALVRQGMVPDDHMPQCQQILLVSGAQRVRFVVSDGTEERKVWTEVEPDRAWWARLAAGWAQFHVDLTTYNPPERAAVVVAEPVQALPAVTVTVDGAITIRDNFPAFETALRDFLDHRLIREPQSDQDFADLDLQIKAMKGAEAALESAEANWIAQIEAVGSAKRRKDMLHKLVRDNRLMAEKLLASEKERRKGEIVAGGVSALRKHIEDLNTRIGQPMMPVIPADFAGAIRGKSSLAKMEDAVDAALANAKIAANETADRITLNLRTMRAHGDYDFLFADIRQHIAKPSDDFQAMVQSRVLAHQAEEKRRAEAAAEKERERIRAEEQAKAEREARAKVEAEQRAQVPVATQAPAPAPNVAPALSSKAPAANSPSVVPIARGKPTLRLGQINERIAPLAVTAAGLESLGFKAAGKEGAAVLFHEADFGSMVDTMVASLRAAQHLAEPVAA